MSNTGLVYCRCGLDAEIIKYVEEAYPKGICSVYCVNGKDIEGPGSDFELAVVISAARHSPQNFWCVNLVKWNFNYSSWWLLSTLLVIQVNWCINNVNIL